MSYSTDRNIPLSISASNRNCPVARPIRLPHKNTESEVPTPRRRIAVACARCRKRKIRCSGDPGNGTGCENCRQAGTDTNLCQFHRVGSVDCGPTLLGTSPMRNHISSFMSLPNMSINSGMPSSPAVYSMYPRGLPLNHYTGLIGKTPYSPNWPQTSYSNDSPIESFSLGTSNNLHSAESLRIYGGQDGGRAWPAMGHHPSNNGHNMFLDQDASAFATSNLSYIAAPVARQQSAVATEGYQPFTMHSLHSSLPSPAGRQLPVPSNMSRGFNAGSSIITTDAIPNRQISSSLPNDLSAMTPFGTQSKSTVTWTSGAAMPERIGHQDHNGGSSRGVASPMPPKRSASSNCLQADALGYGDCDIFPAHSPSPPTARISAQSITRSASPPIQRDKYSNFVASYSVSSDKNKFSVDAEEAQHLTDSHSLSLSGGETLIQGDDVGRLYRFSTDSVVEKTEDGMTEAFLASGKSYTPLEQLQGYTTFGAGGLEERREGKIIERF